ncbi:hypothetical protein [Tenacibaculum sp. 190524A02b]
MKKATKLSIIIMGAFFASCGTTQNSSQSGESILTNLIFSQGDDNGDGYLSFAEVWEIQKDDEDEKKIAQQKGMSLKEMVKQDFNKADVNKDARLSKKEFAASLQDVSDSKS